ncbi:hypothetical protein ACEQPO_30875 [Bacillus sp. SL00103]
MFNYLTAIGYGTDQDEK